VGCTHEDCLTQFGKDVFAAGLKLGKVVVIPQLAFDRLA
jgi:hypothetical protein